MAINAGTLRQARALRVAVGAEADQATRDLTAAWVRAWSALAPDLRAALSEAATLAVQFGRWPHPWELARIGRLATALRATQDALATLGQRAGVTVTDAAGNAIRATVDAEPRLIASQLPAAQQTAAAVTFAQRILPAALDAIVARTTGQITALTRPLSRQATAAMHRELIRGVALGSSPREAGREMVARVEGAFNGGLGRAVNIARTEILDAYRITSRYSHTANSDVVRGWQWSAQLDRRACFSCISMNGSEHPLSEAGPLDHQSGRCARVPLLKPWRELGINLDEPPSTSPDARAWFRGLPEADRIAIAGPTRLELLRTGAVGWDDMATRRTSTGWRDSYVPTPVRDLQRLAGRNARVAA